MLGTIDELQSSESSAQLTAKRAERELRDERETRTRLEREMEGWKALRIERGSVRNGVSGHLGLSAAGSDAGDVRSRRGSMLLSGELPHRQLRKVSGQSFL